MMWDMFPHSVLLLKKNRDIVAVNKKAQERGVRAGGKCFQLGDKSKTEIHTGCKANVALEKGMAERSVSYREGATRVTDTYWIPVAMEKDLFMHFTIATDLQTKEPSTKLDNT
jgi:hypothetical protein